MAVYNDFNWDREVRDKKGNNIMSFKKINIIYGRNYSGKTTLSRIIRSLEIGSISDKYINPEFRIEFDEEIKPVTQESYKSHPFEVRVFNEDFIKDNLKFIANPDASINSFAILGDDNIRIEEEIKKLEVENFGADGISGIKGKHTEKNSEILKQDRERGQIDSALNDKLRRKANDDIKANSYYGDVRYNISKILEDIKKISASEYTPCLAEDEVRLLELIKEDKRPEIPSLTKRYFMLPDILTKTKELLSKEISISQPIIELVNDSLLQGWVKMGRELHYNKKERCGFCGAELPLHLWEKLDLHFNKESEELERAVLLMQSEIKKEISFYENNVFFSSMWFYSKFKEHVDAISEDFHSSLKSYINELGELNRLLDVKRNDIFTPVELPNIKDNTTHLLHLIKQYDDIRAESNQLTHRLVKEQLDAKNILRLNEVYKFKTAINYSLEKSRISNINTILANLRMELIELSNKINNNNEKIAKLKTEVQDEKKGADKVNFYMSNYFGHKSLCLEAIEKEEGFKFEVMRGKVRAHHLSEGECSLLSFCYFMAKMDDLSTKNTKPIIWLDDPICSLDTNHIFFVYSLISSEIMKQDRFSQVFISTHNLDFLKYLKRLPGASDGKKANYFIVERIGENSSLKEMPRYLKSYVTEFNYLFEQIYKCAKANLSDDDSQDSFYNFGNNARKFLESFLYYKYPNAIEKDDKISRFFNDGEIGSVLLNRVLNEYSHLDGGLERGALPIDIPEMQIAAEYILEKIKLNDQVQYVALLHSIGIQDV